MARRTELAYYSNSRKILHIVFTHLTGGTLRQSSIPCRRDVLVWWDNPAVGPTPQTASLEEMTGIRTRYMRKPLAFQYRKKNLRASELPSLAKRDRLLRRCGEWREVVLWFGPPAIEQFPMLQILAALGDQKLDRTRLTRASSPKHVMGVYRPAELSTFFDSRVPISRQQIQGARRAWRLYCAPNPLPLFRLARQQRESQPLLCSALLRQMQEFPSVFNGLSLLEEALLSHVESAITVARVVGRVLCNDEIGYLTGDYELFEMMWQFLHATEPLLEPRERSLAAVQSSLEFRRLPVRLTPMGRDVLANKRDNIVLNGIDRWIGGVHLKGKAVRYRWDTQTSVLRAV